MTALRRPPPPPTPAARSARAGGWRISERRWPGRHPTPVVLVHGLNAAGALMVPTAGHLAGDFEVRVPDLPGFGGSERPPEALPVTALGAALARWMEAAGAAPAAVVALSFGCQVVAEAAMRRPDLVERLVLAAPTIDPTARTAPAQVRAWRRERRTQSPALRRLLVREYRRTGIPRALATFGHALADRIEDRLPFLDAPALIVRGSDDPIVSGPWAAEAARLLPHGRLAVLPGGPHAMAFDAPRSFAAAVRAFLVPSRPPGEESLP